MGFSVNDFASEFVSRRWRSGVKLSGVIIILATSHAHAQSAIAEHDRIDRRLPQAHKSTSHIRRRSAPRQKNVSEVRPFVLKGVVLQGSSITQVRFSAAWEHYLGRTIATSDVNTITDAVAALYEKTDVALYTVTAPDQNDPSGELRLIVTEDYVSALDIDADQGVHVSNLVKRLAKPILKERPLTRSSLDRFLGLVRAIPGVTVDGQFTRTDTLGAVHLHLTLHQKKATLSIGYTNSGQRLLDQSQIDATFTLNSLFREGDQTQLSTIDSPGSSHLRYYALSHAEPLVGGATIQGNLGYLTTRIEGISGHAASAGLQLAFPLYTSQETMLTVTTGVDGLNVDNAFVGEALTSDHTRAFRLSAAFTHTSPHSTLMLGSSLSQGLDIFAARVASPILSDLRFTKFTYNASLEERFGRSWAIRFNSLGQFGFNALPNAEQLPLGGPTAGRAFNSVIASGDSGIYGAAEFARLWSGGPHAPLLPAEAYAFVDAGYARYRERGTAPGFDQSLSSIGLGTRLTLYPGTVLELEAAKSVSQHLIEHQDDSRINIRIRATL